MENKQSLSKCPTSTKAVCVCVLARAGVMQELYMSSSFPITWHPPCRTQSCKSICSFFFPPADCLAPHYMRTFFLHQVVYKEHCVILWGKSLCASNVAKEHWGESISVKHKFGSDTANIQLITREQTPDLKQVPHQKLAFYSFNCISISIPKMILGRSQGTVYQLSLIHHLLSIQVLKPSPIQTQCLLYP